MRIHAASLAFLVSLFAVVVFAALSIVNCGGGEAKAAFERYDAAVSPLLKEETEIYRQFAELTADAVHFDAIEKVGTHIRERLVPFNARLGERVREIQPEGEELTRIHGFLVRYVKLRAEYLDSFGQILAFNQRSRTETQPARDRLTELTKIVERKGNDIQPAFVAAPELAANLRETLTQIASTAQQVEQMLAGLDRGTFPTARYLQTVDTQVLPWLRKTKKDIQSLGATGAALNLQAAVVEYIGAVEDLIVASRPLAETRAPYEKQEAELQRRVTNLQNESDRTMQVFKEEAQKYRHGLR